MEVGRQDGWLSCSCIVFPAQVFLVPFPFILLAIAAGNFVRLVESFPSIKPLNLLQESDRLGPNGSRFTSFQAPSIRLTVAADGPVILSIFHTQTSGLLTALCTLGNCFCCELNFNESISSFPPSCSPCLHLSVFMTLRRRSAAVNR